MNYKVLVDGHEHIIKKQIQANDRQTDNKAREEIINHYLDIEKASEVSIVEAYEEGTRTITRLLSQKSDNLPSKGGLDL